MSDLPFPVYAQRFDPYKNFKFQVKWDGKHIYGISAGEAPSSPIRE